MSVISDCCHSTAELIKIFIQVLKFHSLMHTIENKLLCSFYYTLYLYAWVNIQNPYLYTAQLIQPIVKSYTCIYMYIHVYLNMCTNGKA